MKIAKIISLAGLLAMTGILIYGFTIGNLLSEGAELALSIRIWLCRPAAAIGSVFGLVSEQSIEQPK